MLIKEFKIGNKTLKIVTDDHAESPRSWDNLGTLVLHKSVGDITDFRFADDYSSEADVLERGPKEIAKHFGPIGAILPVYKYEHSGVCFSTTPYSCKWDSGLAGFIFATKKDIRENWGIKRVTKARVEQVEKQLVSEVEVYSQWAEGDIVGFQLEEDGEETDSCYGFFGQDVTTNGILDHLDEEWEPILKGVAA
jgi:hypothetical protein